jgi:hypothetical protein
MRFIVLLLAFAFLQSTPSVKQEQPKKETAPTQEAPKSTREPTSPIIAPVSQPTPKPEAGETKDKSSSWPPLGDVFWPSWALVIVTIVAVRAALKTLGSINAQVDEMRRTGEQTDKLIVENIAQSKAMQQSVAESARLAAAMEAVANHIAVSAKAATDSVAALKERTAQQMRAYLAVVIGTGVYQERDKNLRFEGKPFLINTGHTPAHMVCYKAKAAILPVPAPKDFGFQLGDEVIGGSILGPQQNANLSGIVDDFVDDAEVEDIKTSKGKALYVWGIVTYEDIFGEAHYTKFCQCLIWLPDGKVFGVYIAGHNDAT